MGGPLPPLATPKTVIVSFSCTTSTHKQRKRRIWNIQLHATVIRLLYTGRPQKSQTLTNFSPYFTLFYFYEGAQQSKELEQSHFLVTANTVRIDLSFEKNSILFFFTPHTTSQQSLQLLLYVFKKQIM